MLRVLLAAAGLLVASACASLGPAAPPPPEVVRQPVDCEHLEYVIVENGTTTGRGALHAAYRDAQVRAGWEFRQQYQQAGDDESAYTDSTQAYVTRAFTPMRSDRSIVRPEENESYGGDYERTPGVVTLRKHRREGNRESESSADLRLRPHAFDNESAFWLWRALPLAEGYTTRYTSVNVYDRTQASVDLTVVGRGPVTVPIGTLEAWRVLVVSGRATRTAWIEVAPPHRLVQWDSGAALMQLEGDIGNSYLCLPQMAKARERR